MVEVVVIVVMRRKEGREEEKRQGYARFCRPIFAKTLLFFFIVLILVYFPVFGSEPYSSA